MKIIRRNTFETNSSSTHSITMCTESEFEKWKNGEMYFVEYEDKLISEEEYLEKIDNLRRECGERHPEYDEEEIKDYIDDYCYCKTYEEWEQDDYLEHYINEYTTPNNEKIIAFGAYGYNG